MKKVLFYLSILIFASCSSDIIKDETIEDMEIEANEEEKEEQEKTTNEASNASITKWTEKFYQPDNTGLVLTTSTEIILENNRIQSFSGLSNIQSENPRTIKGEVEYLDDKIYRFERFSNDTSSERRIYKYVDGLISKINIRNLVSLPNEYSYSRIEFQNQRDTIYVNTYSSNDDDIYELTDTKKVVLNQDFNRVYYEFRDIETSYDYDENENIVNISNEFSNHQYTYSDIINTESIIYEATFGKRTNMLWENGSLLGSVKTLNKNVFRTGTKMSSQNNFSLTLNIEEANQDGYLTKLSYYNSDINSEIQSEFIID